MPIKRSRDHRGVVISAAGRATLSGDSLFESVGPADKLQPRWSTGIISCTAGAIFYKSPVRFRPCPPCHLATSRKALQTPQIPGCSHARPRSSCESLRAISEGYRTGFRTGWRTARRNGAESLTVLLKPQSSDRSFRFPIPKEPNSKPRKPGCPSR